MAYSWHREYCDQAVKKLIATAGKKYAAFMDSLIDLPAEGWLAWFERMHPELFRKFAESEANISALCRDNTATGKEKYKAAIKVWAEAVGWAVDRYIEYHVDSIIIPMKGTPC